MYAGQQPINREKTESNIDSQSNQLQISRNLNSAQSNSKVNNRKKVVAAGGGS